MNIRIKLMLLQSPIDVTVIIDDFVFIAVNSLFDYKYIYIYIFKKLKVH